MSFYDRLKEERIVVILRDVPDEHLLAVADALYTGGIRLLEITMNTEGAAQQIESLSREFDGKLLVGAGTVLDKEIAETALRAGAKYLITPNLDVEVLDFGRENQVDVLPGVMTPSEIVMAHRAGARMVKLFPTKSLGLDYFKELQGPLRHIPMVAVGGVTLQNAKEFLAAGAVGIGIGGSILNQEAMRKGNYHVIREKARAFVEAVKE
ncbi:bifunctional 4-hydroxy-2-oxoglutarate aldolase/2-dehydro-3-deoxy-phosphogluconate aldolase [Ammoniphilus sp. CFH 90114]|uniref:bifunctional 4-hydroxy-2-oxoglutarate aldolase/2-dehydro-3-deoxy-phosphogluconate aldolase n=1 Tax=Ammoniphilus sp. CFH 90114 TaxID=2493665 RepID=UPI00100E97EB|nr:bifunctional 4-hydroxy-2-oxoglutarate aldolase/2-dehydro-3-deoxy-phosphogluconate aldolase [Ammoniphilus sp. CFH 90114]RXT07990.1 bifunctional 4-hydroxy-2-oxoglutarate aldolase/2-dehydro-3-deoxy-phosphogluconate aldolase [Ammoniphilus sp. CFH 90114]